VAFVLCVIASPIAFFWGKHSGPTTEKSKLSEPSRGPSSQAHKGNEEIFAQLLSDKCELIYRHYLYISFIGVNPKNWVCFCSLCKLL
jgi:hypothetical protein